MLPALSTINEVFTQSFYFLRRTISGNSFQNEIVIRLIIEATEKWLLSKKLPDCVIVIMNDGIFLRDLVLEDKKPVILKDCYSQSKIKRLSMTADITSY